MLTRIHKRGRTYPAGLSDEPPRFCDLSAQEQREAIEEWWTQKTYQQGLLGEAVNEHRLYPQIRAAFVAGDTAELGRLVDQAVREYCGEVMELDP